MAQSVGIRFLTRRGQRHVAVNEGDAGASRWLKQQGLVDCINRQSEARQNDL
jgi:hypothetical protein